MPTFGEWERVVLEHTFDHVEFISLHTYLNNYAGDAAAFLASPDLMDSFIEEVVAIADDSALCSLSAKANFKRLGKRLGPKMKAVAAAVEKLDSASRSRIRWVFLGSTIISRTLPFITSTVASGSSTTSGMTRGWSMGAAGCQTGAGAVNQAVKALVLATGYLREDGIQVVCIPEFADVTIDEKVRTAIKLVIEPTPDSNFSSLRFSSHVRSDLARAEVLYTSLLLQASSQVRRSFAPPGENVAAYRRSWLAGFTRAVVGRLTESEDRAAQTARTSGPAPGGRSVSLVLADRSVAVSSAMEDAYPHLRKAQARSLSGSGGRSGYLAGQRADLGGARVGRGVRGRLGAR